MQIFGDESVTGVRKLLCCQIHLKHVTVVIISEFTGINDQKRFFNQYECAFLSALLYEDAAFHVNSTVTTNLCISQTIPAAPSPPPSPPPPPSFYETFSRLTAPGVGICQPRGPHRDFWHSRSFQCKYITTQRILLGKQADWIICQGARGQRIKEDCKGMFSFLCMYSFIAYQARIT